MSTSESQQDPSPIDAGNAQEHRADTLTEHDSALGDDTASETTSLAQSVLNYEYENGRRYHSYRAGHYVLPNDEAEQDRLDMQHHSYLLILKGELYRAPLTKINRVLDVGCGTGIWAMDFADTYPEAHVIGIDLSPIQPTWVPPNVSFQIDDAEVEWDYRQPFDYIHIRGMSGSIGDWPKLMEQAYHNLRPGGWVELCDYEQWGSTDDNSVPETSSWHEYQTRVAEASQTFGREMNMAPKFKKFVEDAGFTSIVAEQHKVPLSPWNSNQKLKELGRYMSVQMTESIEAYALALFSRVLKWDSDRIQRLFAGVRADLKNMDYHLYTVLHCVVGQKPE